jgi:catechol-2,3-dioxygenase
MMEATTMSARRVAVRGLGEVALRVNNLDVMQKFYEEVVGLQLMRRAPDSAFLRIADGFDGHTQVLALFDRSGDSKRSRPDAAKSTIDHIAFEIALADFERELQRLRPLGCEIQTAEHAWVHWRSFYLHDPEGNEVEFVCHDSSI